MNRPGTGLDAIERVAPDIYARLQGLRSLAGTTVDPAIVEVCQQRMASLLGVAPEPTAAASRPGVQDKLDRLASWPTSPMFSATDRACIAFTEQFVMDVSSVTDADVAAVQAELGPGGVYGLVLALQVFDGRYRLDAALAAMFPGSDL